MFPRRRTDQVYSTLQQVQRRITEQGGGAVPPGGQVKAMPPVAIPSRQPMTVVPPIPAPPSPVGFGTMTPTVSAPTSVPVETYPTVNAPALPATAPVPQQSQSTLPPQPALYPPASGSRRYVVQISSDMAMLIGVIWVATMVLSYVLGRYQTGGSAGAGIASGLAGNREVVEMPVKAERLYILVLQRSPASPAIEKNFKDAARTWNDYARKNPQRGIQPFFDVRRTKAGQAEFFYGNLNGKLGVSQDLAFAELMSKSQYQGGGGFGSANWVAVDD